MLIDKSLIIQAKEKLGDKAALLINDYFKLENWDEKNLKGSCPFGHSDSDPSFLWNAKDLCFHCFSCGRNYGIVDLYMEKDKKTYLGAVEKLFSETDINFRFSEKGVKTDREYKYPVRVYQEDRSIVESYWASRGISAKTLDYADVQQDEKGNTVFHYYDLNDVLCMAKYRVSRNFDKNKEPQNSYKFWHQANTSSMPILYGINQIDPTKELLIVEGEADRLSVIEAGFTNVVSVPNGAPGMGWIEKCWDFLEQFNKIIIWSDNDRAGLDLRKEACNRLGNWRTLYVDVPSRIKDANSDILRNPKDANDVLVHFGKQAVLDYINNAQDSPVQGVVNLADVPDFDLATATGLYTRIKPIDDIVYKFLFGSVILLTGIKGCVDGDTEFFNGKQWKPIKNYEINDMVLQYEKDGSSRLVKPVQYHKYPQEYLWHFSTKYGIDQCLSDEHEIVYLTSKNRLAKKSFYDFRANYEKHGFSGKFPTTFEYGGTGIPYNDITIRLMIASICDGSYYYELSENAKTYSQCRFHLKKETKKQRIEDLIIKSGYDWSKKESNNAGYTDFYVKMPIRIKQFEDWWYNCTKEQLEIVCDECLYWDGCVNNNRKSFSTTIKQNADFIQFAFTATGHTSTITTCDRRGRIRTIKNKTYTTNSIDYNVIITNRKHLYPISSHAYRGDFIKPYKTKDGFKYCFTVDSGMLILRRNNRIFITGNSGKSAFLNQAFVCESLEQGHDVFIFSGELDNSILKSWIEIAMAGREKITMQDNFVHVIDKKAKARIKDWYSGRLWVYDENNNSADAILDKAINVTRKYGVKTWVIDNLMTLDIGASDTNIWQKQKDFIVKLVGLAKLYNVLVVLVSHPRKVMVGADLTSDDISGSNDLGNLAQYICSVHRYSTKEKEGTLSGRGGFKSGCEPIPYDVAVTLLKNRYTGKLGTAKLYFDYPDYRFYSSVEELYKRYGWWDKKDKESIPVPKIDPNIHENIPPTMK